FTDTVIALDDGSTDETADVLEASPLVKVLVRNPRRRGYEGWDDGANRRALLRAAGEVQPDWGVFLDADERSEGEDAVALRDFVQGGDALPGCAFGFQHFRMWKGMTCDPESRWIYGMFS